MPREAKGLSARQAETLGDGKHADGRGLNLIVRGAYRAWFFFYTSPSGRRREMLLDHCSKCSLKDARDKADAARQLLKQGIDPLGEREAAKAAAVEATKAADAKHAGGQSLRRFARAYHDDIEADFSNRKCSAQWIGTLENHVFPTLGDKALASVTAGDLLDVLRPLYLKVPATARRIRQRLEAVYNEAILRDLVAANPAAKVRAALRKKGAKAANGSHLRALPYAELPALLKKTRALPATAARAFEFAVLTAARTGEVLGMKWDELSRDGKTWTVPPERMKQREPHTVALSAAAQAVLKRVRGLSKAWVFPSPQRDAPLSNMAMLTLLHRLKAEKRTTVHGAARTAFSTWANETGAARPEVIEAALAHREADIVRAAYNRAEFQAERGRLLAAWARYLR